MESRPLEGIVVVDLTWNLPGPYASFLLASLGADVIKVEPPNGDPARAMPRLFELLNAGKRGVTLDLRDEPDRERLRELFATADVVLEGFRPGVAARLGCSAADAHRVNERLVYCSISAYGQDGPLRDLPGHDLNTQALSGVCHLGRDAREHPHGLALPVADLSAAMSAVASITSALYARTRDGRGRVLDVAMLDGPVSWANVWGRGVDLAGDAERSLPPSMRRWAGRLVARLDRERLHALPHYGVFRCADDRWISVGIVHESHFWKAFCEILGSRRMAKLPVAARTTLGPVLRRWIALRLRRSPAETWLRTFAERGVPVSPVLTPEEALKHPQVVHRMVDADGRVRAPLPGAGFVTGPVPRLSTGPKHD